jgi:hypothetical protein
MTTNANNPIDAYPEPSDLLETLEITKVECRSSVGGTWVTGRIAGYRFEALVFPEPALNREWEVGGDSRISKLWVGDANGREIYAWDRGPGTPAASPTVEMIVELLSEGLAETIFEND